LPNVTGLRKEDVLNWDCITQTEKIRNAYKILVKEVWRGGKDDPGNICIDERIILNWVFGK
jgi:hypothetical protein